MLLLVLACTAISVFMVIVSVYSLINSERYDIKQRLKKIDQDTATVNAPGSISFNAANSVEEEADRPFRTRLFVPVKDALADVVKKITPRGIITGYEKLIACAGTPNNLSANDWLTIQMVFLVCLPSLTIFIGLAFKAAISSTMLVAVIEIILILFWPRIILTQKAQQRRKEINATLPNILDFITVSVEAGLGFDAALGMVVSKMPCALCSEFERALQEIKMGKSRKEALKNMSNRIGIVDFTTFVAAVIQADQLGVSIGNVLRIQSHQMRLKRRQAIQEKAMKAPVKMLFPMVLFIFPTIFVVILGPMAITLFDTFFKK